ncbi:CRISPR-associated endonuclease Cas2 [Arsukibacterium sp. MJ3]|uniref:CRISPR-associated endonuclease Cas2 n=1 Tax=Arsukibacterium sp. MJ3 TaxID=1632859 RepID=UPI00069A1CA8|nr:CRISPR-associated endonuclease Cas2 [Arsukibacterium sp. MJ3]
MTNCEHWYVISYDIRERKRLARLHRYLKRYSFMLQESVYLFVGNKTAWQTLKTELEKRIKKHEDDVRVYKLDKECCFNFFGSSPWPQGLYFGGYPRFTLTPLLAVAV